VGLATGIRAYDTLATQGVAIHEVADVSGGNYWNSGIKKRRTLRMYLKNREAA